MPWTKKQVRLLESSASPLTSAQKAKMNRELHANPAMGHAKKGSKALKKSGRKMGNQHMSSESSSYNFRDHLA